MNETVNAMGKHMDEHLNGEFTVYCVSLLLLCEFSVLQLFLLLMFLTFAIS